MNTLMEYDPVELENEIFTLNHANDQINKPKAKESKLKKAHSLINTHSNTNLGQP